jgi:hypothetical protein
MPRLDQDLSDVQDDDMQGGSWRALPDGEYACEIVESDYKRTKKGDGMVLKLKVEILEPEHRGRHFFDHMTLQHPNADTVRIARAQLKRVAVAVRHPNPNMIGDSVELHNVPMLAKLTREKSKGNFGDADGYENRVMAYNPMGSQTAAPKNAPRPQTAADDIPF